jgi:hypothetical protein
MPTITVTVLRNEEPAEGVRAVLEFSGLGGMSEAEYTGSDGKAEFDVDDGREGEVFVDGAKVDHWGSYSATDFTVNL